MHYFAHVCAWTAIFITATWLFAILIDCWTKDLDADVDRFQEKLMQHSERHMQAAALLDAANEISRKVLGEESHEIHLSVTYQDGLWRLAADFWGEREFWFAVNRERAELLTVWKHDGAIWAAKALMASQKTR